MQNRIEEEADGQIYEITYISAFVEHRFCSLEEYERFGILLDVSVWCEKDGSKVRSCSHRGPEFRSQHPQSSLQVPELLFLRL